MKYADIARGALVLALGMMTSTVLAQASYSEAFEGATLTNVLEATGLSGSSAWKGGADDISAIVAGTPDKPVVGYPLPAAGHDKVLQLNTEGGTLTNELTSAADFSAANVFVDSMVKFVPSEDLATFDDAGIKVAAYAFIKEEGENVSTNLALYHGGFILGTATRFTTNTVVTNITVDASAWYRLTILLANDDSFENKGEHGSQAFQIYINGVLLTNSNAHAGDSWTDVSDADLLDGPDPLGTWFVSAASLPESQQVVETLQFRGTGFVDDLVVGGGTPFFSQGEPEPPAPYGITQSIGSNGSAEPDDVLLIVPAGATTSVTYSAVDFYVINSLKTNTTEVSGAAGAKQVEVTFDATNDVVATFAVASAYASAPVGWFQANGWGEDDIVPDLPYAELEMLNVAATNAAAGGTITIEAIEVVGDDVKVTVFIDRTMSLGADINGVIKLYGAETLEGAFTEIGAMEIMIGADQDGTPDDILKEITYPMAGGKKFYKAHIEAATPAP